MRPGSAPRLRLAILYPGDRAMRDRADPTESRFLALFDAFRSADVGVEPAVYHDDFRDEVRLQLAQVDGVLVWHNPLEDGRDRTHLDELLRDVASSGVMVSTHPDMILKLGTKDVLLAVRDLPFGTDAHRVESLAQLQGEVLDRLQSGARVLKQRRGHSGIGVWRIERRDAMRYVVRHAQRGSIEEVLGLGGLLQRLAPYFESGGQMIDQAWQPRVAEGMTRAYLVRDRVAGFGHQALVALAPLDEAGAARQSGPRLYSGADDPRFQELRKNLERTWVGMLCERLVIDAAELPLLWDADFLLGEDAGDVGQRHVLCEINVSSVSPFPDAAIQPLVKATLQGLRWKSQTRARPRLGP
jgi:hypothetical protein